MKMRIIRFYVKRIIVIKFQINVSTKDEIISSLIGKTCQICWYGLVCLNLTISVISPVLRAGYSIQTQHGPQSTQRELIPTSDAESVFWQDLTPTHQQSAFTFPFTRFALKLYVYTRSEPSYDVDQERRKRFDSAAASNQHHETPWPALYIRMHGRQIVATGRQFCVLHAGTNRTEANRTEANQIEPNRISNPLNLSDID